MPILKLN